MRVIGIDPGSNITGYGIIDKVGARLVHIDNGCLATKKKSSLPERLRVIYEALMEIIEKYHPDAFAIEEVFYAKNIASSIKLGESRGVALLAAAQKNLPIFEYSTRAVKQAVTGYGQADKPQVQKMIQHILKLPEVAQADASDALALAVCHANTFRPPKEAFA